MLFKTEEKVYERIANLEARCEERARTMKSLHKFPGDLIYDQINDRGEIAELKEWLKKNAKNS